MYKTLFAFVCFLGAFQLSAQELRYTPKNPNFGGNTFNYQWLLSSANAQNSFTAKGSSREEQSRLDSFKESIDRQLLSQLNRAILAAQTGPELQEGSFDAGSFLFEVFETEEGLVINILDKTTGEQTQVIVPN
ncbi:curli assembly protein CsgF [Robertkochia sediminum]|uniref:curli assembly protein CsgF n=1 Tax=Robertkochia sediminum TaxID=2785326 RepID=UPI001931CDF3|nr:curli assembly protein CsgF [Robertkochia sediminum]MBL7471283.1 curli assembly protein CsgF [Robertkochia sediminum]